MGEVQGGMFLTSFASVSSYRVVFYFSQHVSRSLLLGICLAVHMIEIIHLAKLLNICLARMSGCLNRLVEPKI